MSPLAAKDPQPTPRPADPGPGGGKRCTDSALPRPSYSDWSGSGLHHQPGHTARGPPLAKILSQPRTCHCQAPADTRAARTLPRLSHPDWTGSGHRHRPGRSTLGPACRPRASADPEPATARARWAHGATRAARTPLRPSDSDWPRVNLHHRAARHEPGRTRPPWPGATPREKRHPTQCTTGDPQPTPTCHCQARRNARC
jgi:hypothetical protein